MGGRGRENEVGNSVLCWHCKTLAVVTMRLLHKHSLLINAGENTGEGGYNQPNMQSNFDLTSLYLDCLVGNTTWQVFQLCAGLQQTSFPHLPLHELFVSV